MLSFDHHVFNKESFLAFLKIKLMRDSAGKNAGDLKYALAFNVWIVCTDTSLLNAGVERDCIVFPAEVLVKTLTEVHYFIFPWIVSHPVWYEVV